MKTISHKLDRELKKAKKAVQSINELFIKEFRGSDVPIKEGRKALSKIAKTAKKIRQLKRIVEELRAEN